MNKTPLVDGTDLQHHNIMQNVVTSVPSREMDGTRIVTKNKTTPSCDGFDVDSAECGRDNPSKKQRDVSVLDSLLAERWTKKS